jgi:twinkle protein
MTPASLAALLHQQAERVCQYLLPNGRRIGSDWVAGDAYGGEGQSFKIAVTGEKVGVGADFAGTERCGDLLDLWCLTNSVGLGEAMAQASSYLGIVMDGEETKPKREFKRPERPKLARRLDKAGKVYAYLKGRGLTDQALEDFRVAEESDQWMVFPYLREDGVVCGAWADGFFAQGEDWSFVPVYPKVIGMGARQKYTPIGEQAFKRWKK